MRIAIIGAASSKRDAPYSNPDWQIWACSCRNMAQLPRWDAWFELHDPLGPEDYVGWLQTLPLVYVRKTPMGLPGERPYPERELKRRFGPFFFTSSIAYMMALAIALEPKEIGLWGVSMATNEEYEYQRPGCHYFIQRAWDQGVTVTLPKGSTLLNPPEDRW